MKNKQIGITLIESLIALVILSFGIIATTKIQVFLTYGNQLARQRLDAVAIAESRLEHFRNLKSCTAETEYTFTPYQGSAEFTVNTTCTDAQTPVLLVKWNDSKGTQTKVAGGDWDNQVILSTTISP